MQYLEKCVNYDITIKNHFVHSHTIYVAVLNLLFHFVLTSEYFHVHSHNHADNS